MSFRLKYLNKSGDVFIYGRDNEDIFKNYFKNVENINFNPSSKIIFFNIKILFLTMSAYLSVKSIKTAYLIALIKYFNPKYVLTQIDNDRNFWQVARFLQNKIRFIAFQNGAGYDLYKNPHKNDIFIPEYVCFGDHTVQLIKSLNGKVKKFYPYGSIKEVLFRGESEIYKKFKKKTLKKEFDICVIADNFDGLNKNYPNIEQMVATVAEYALRYSKKNNLKIVFAFKRPEDFKNARITEKEFYEQFFKFDYQNIYYSFRNSSWTSYETICKSTLTIGLSSTLLIESASRGNKVLICDFYDELYSLGAKEPLSYSTLNPRFHIFSERVKDILDSKDVDFFNERRDEIKRLMNISEDMTIDKLISSIINQ